MGCAVDAATGRYSNIDIGRDRNRGRDRGRDGDGNRDGDGERDRDGEGEKACSLAYVRHLLAEPTINSSFDR